MILYKAWRAVAFVFTIFAIIAGIVFLRSKWVPGVDFDLTGIFWVIHNIGRIGALVIFFLCAGAAISFWYRAYLAE